jgi:hypothetical protein
MARHVLIVLLSILLAACGGPTASVPPSLTATLAPSAASPPPPTATPELTPTSLTLLTPSAEPTLTPSAAPSDTPEPQPTALAQGRTPEGYQTLGNPDAPLTLVMFSDFL